jgi:vacuolar-type H+-ATPase subunit H
MLERERAQTEKAEDVAHQAYQNMLDREHKSHHKVLDVAHQGHQAEINRTHQKEQAFAKGGEVKGKKPNPNKAD